MSLRSVHTHVLRLYIGKSHRTKSQIGRGVHEVLLSYSQEVDSEYAKESLKRMDASPGTEPLQPLFIDPDRTYTHVHPHTHTYTDTRTQKHRHTQPQNTSTHTKYKHIQAKKHTYTLIHPPPTPTHTHTHTHTYRCTH